jgi:tRNA A-37 threonylcarbamoyl transferase component Bud32
MAGFAQKPTDPTAPPEELPLRPGQAFHGLEILELLGKGGMGIVYKARQPALDRMIALKILPQKMALDPDFQNRFIREAKALGSLNHPNIVAVYDFGAENGLFFFAMEFVDGTNLRQILRDRKLNPEQALKIVPQLCDALEYAHGEGVVHRDIKPENILLDKKGRVKIADFGLAKLIGADVAQAGMLTMTNMVMGTPHYMAPEQVENPKGVDHRADIYAIGVVLYEMLTGELPIGRFEIPSKKVQIDVRLDDVVLKALEKSPDRRYQKASEVKDAVTLATSIKAADSYSPTVITPMPARKGGNRPMFAMAGVTAAAVVLALVAFLKNSPPPPTPGPVIPPVAGKGNDPVGVPEPVDLTKIYFTPEDRPGGYVYQQPGTGLPRNPMPAKDAADIDTLVKLLDNVGIQNVDRSDIKQGYISAWWRWSVAFVALETPAAERIEKNFLGLESLKNRWTHRKGSLLVMAWTQTRDYREVFNQLVALLQKKLGLPVNPPDVPLANLTLRDHDVPKGWTLETKPGADATRHEVTLEGPDGMGSLFIGAYSLDTAERARSQEGDLRKRLEKGATRVEILPAGRTVLAIALYGKAVGTYEKVAEELRQCMGLPSRSWEILVPAPAELPEGYTIDKVETDVKTVFQLSGIEGPRESDVRHAWRATLKPNGVIVLLETEDSTVRSTLRDHLSKRGPAWDSGSWSCGVEGPDDVALDAIENRMREKFGWDRNQPRPLQLLSARLTPADLPAGFELSDETVDRRVFACTIRTPQGPLQCKIQQTFDYGLIGKMRKELPYTPGDLVLIKDTVVAYVGGPEACWPALDQLEAILRKKMRLGAPEILEVGFLLEQLPKGSLYLDRPPQNTPNPRTLKHTSPEVTGWWQAVVDPSETRIEIFQLRDAAAARAWEAGLIDARKKPDAKAPAHAATFTRGSFVISLEQQKPGEAVFAALSEIARGKLRLKKL